MYYVLMLLKIFSYSWIMGILLIFLFFNIDYSDSLAYFLVFNTLLFKLDLHILMNIVSLKGDTYF